MSDSTELLGELLVRMDVRTEEHLEKVLEYQKEHPDLPFGQIAIRLGYITDEILNEYL